MALLHNAIFQPAQIVLI